MTVQEFHIAFDIELDKTLDFEYAYILPEQKDYWLNKGQDRFVKQRAFGNNYTGKSFEQNEKRIDDLRTIVKQSVLINSTNVGTDYFVTLPTDYQFLFRHRCNTTDSLNGTQLVSGIQTDQDEINVFLIDPFWKPIFNEPLYYILGNNIIYETKGNFSVDSALLTYIKKYAKIQYGSIYSSPTTDIQCELPIHTHQEILDISISLVLENIESQRYQTNLSELTKSE